ncbi:hypothetical protein DH2020_039124 [Rehmannia glutinosa]|uniref:CID domain-containing protein n=1 Tax=Rehmannia glutinosa TaxID=99300 RepID=A0ABR0UWP5_REHGL
MIRIRILVAYMMYATSFVSVVHISPQKAKQVVETWEKLFKSAQPQQQVAFLYLSNDILQNSRRKGSDFVNEFWKVLPTTLKGVYDGGNENCRKVASRLDDDIYPSFLLPCISLAPLSLIPFVSRSDLVDIWEERKVFGSRGQNLKNEMMGKDPSPVNVVKYSNPIKVVKRDATSLRIKLAVGGLPEKILTAMHLVHDEVVNEEAALNKCRDAVSCVREMEKDVVNASSQGNLQGSDVLDNIQKQENMIQQCISELENSEAIRVALVSQLREALQDQESKLEEIRSELIVARGQIEQAANMKLQLTTISSVSPTVNQQMLEPTFPLSLPTSNMTVPPQTHPLTSFANSTEEESKKATAAAVAAKLAASTSSAQMLTSILSSLVAEEAASMSSGLKRPKLEPPLQFSDAKNPDNSAFFSSAHQVLTSMPPGTTQPISQLNQLQTPFLPPPPPLAPPGNSPANQLGQSNMMGMSYGYGAMAFARPGPPPQQTQPPQQMQQPASGDISGRWVLGFMGKAISRQHRLYTASELVVWWSGTALSFLYINMIVIYD